MDYNWIKNTNIWIKNTNIWIKNTNRTLMRDIIKIITRHHCLAW